jgi:hypothetical protein
MVARSVLHGVQLRIVVKGRWDQCRMAPSDKAVPFERPWTPGRTQMKGSASLSQRRVRPAMPA